MVPVGRHGDDRRIDLAEQLAVIAERRATHLVDDRARARGVGVDHASQFLEPRQLLGVVAPHVPGAYDRRFQ